MIKETQYCQLELTKMFDDLLSYWENHPKETFIDCYKIIREKYNYIEYQIDDLENENDLFTAKLQTDLNLVLAPIISQSFCYGYESIRRNYDQTFSDERNDKNRIINLKNNAISGDRLNYDQILDIIRQAIAHNPESIPNYYYDIDNFVIKFKINKYNSIITLSNNQLLEFLVLFIKNMKEHRYKYLESINLADYLTNEIDDIQKIIINELPTLLNISKIKNLSHYFPFKQQSPNNLCRLLDLQTFLRNAYSSKNLSFEDFLKSEKLKNIYQTSLDFKFDILNTLKLSVIFQTFTSLNIDTIIKNSNIGDNNLQLKRIRNSLIHGTYYTEYNEGLYFHDTPDKTKSEVNLEEISRSTITEMLQLCENLEELLFADSLATT
ncbi:MAG: hypothetical protein E7356_03645 [Clostridiales bacterium]|nr:hypothetical protein [Clostridiales bacterium]